MLFIILLYFLYVQHVSDTTMPIIRGRDYNVDYHIGRFDLQPTATQERNDQCDNQHYSRELLMMGIVVPETCWAYKKYNKIISGI